MGEQHYKRVREKIHVYNFLRGFFTMKVVENSPQNARNCTIFKNFLGGACPQTPLAKACSFAARDMPLCGMYIKYPRNFKVGPPPLKNPAYAPGYNYRIYLFLFVRKIFIEKSPKTTVIYKVQI